MTLESSLRDSSSLHVLVTGASGMIGLSLVRMLTGHGIRVRAMTRSGIVSISSPLLSVVKADIRSLQDVRCAMQDITHVVHLAACKSDEPESEAVNVVGTRHLLSEAQTAGVRLFLHVSTPSASLPHPGLYGSTKKSAEYLVQKASVPFIIVRPSVIYSSWQTGILGSIRTFLSFPVVPVIGAGTVEFAPMHVDDLSALLMHLLSEPKAVGGTFDVGGSEHLSFNAMVGICMDMLGMKKKIMHVPVFFATFIAFLLSWLPHPPLTRSNVAGSQQNVPLDLEPLRRIVPYVARDFRSGLQNLQETDSRILSYVLSGFSSNQFPDQCEVGRYREASTIHSIDGFHRLPPKFLLPALDASSKILCPSCVLQKKLLIAAAIVETTPRSATFLLLKKQSLLWLIVGLFVSSLLSFFALLIGFSLRILCPSLWKSYAGC